MHALPTVAPTSPQGGEGAPTRSLAGRRPPLRRGGIPTFALGALALGALALGALGLGGCRKDPEPNVLFIVVDALRPDHVGAYGYKRATTPTLDSLAAKGILFADVTSPASYTRAAVPSIFTSVFPAAHGVLSQGQQVELLSDDYVTLAEVLKEHTYRTAAFMPNPSLNRAFNFDQGFDLYDDAFDVGDKNDPEAQETAQKIQTRALDWLRSEPDKPFFAYLHYRDVHDPYLPQPPYDTMFDPAARAARRNTPAAGGARRQRRGEAEAATPEEAPAAAATPAAPPAAGAAAGGRPQRSARAARRIAEAQALVVLYDGEIRYTDDQIGTFLATLEREGFLENTIIVVTSDHGEAFSEHNAWRHGGNVYEEQIRVPLIVVLPDGAHAGKRVATPVQTTDLYPTVLELLGLEASEQLQGISLLGAVDAGDPGRAVFSEARVKPKRRGRGDSWDFVAVRAGEWKLIFNRTDRSAKLYNVEADPRETKDLAASERDRVRDLLEVLRTYDAEAAKRRKWTAATENLSPEVVEGLRSLGYVQ